MVSDFQNEIFIKNLAFIIAAAIGILFLIGFYLKNIKTWLAFHSQKKLTLEKKFMDEAYKDSFDNGHWEAMGLGKTYHVILDQNCTLWGVSAFQIKMDQIEKLFSNSKDFPWYQFSKSHHECEKIMLPILKKIRSKYRGQFDQVNPIHVSRIEETSSNLYTWLKNETHLQTVVFTFLDEILNLAKEANVYPSLSLLWSDVISIEVFLPFHHVFENIEEDVKNIFGIECSREESHFKLRLWIAFSLEKIPKSLINRPSDGNLKSAFASRSDHFKKAS